MSAAEFRDRNGAPSGGPDAAERAELRKLLAAYRASGNQNADLVEQLDGTAQVFSLTWHAGDTAEQRTGLIDHHTAVQAELKRRGAQRAGDRSPRRAGHRALRHPPCAAVFACHAGASSGSAVRSDALPFGA